MLPLYIEFSLFGYHYMLIKQDNLKIAFDKTGFKVIAKPLVCLI